MLLVRLRHILGKKIDNKEFELNSIRPCINEVINEYPFYNNKREIMSWDDKSNKDFIYTGNNLLTKHVLFNLIKNALKAIKEAGRGKIYISLKHDKKFNYLVFKDTASGIPAEVCETLFQQYSSGSRDGAGLGLAFCKMVMQAYGGDIICNSKEGKYAEFVLNFPRL
jgi:signal transduction histidine kinase